MSLREGEFKPNDKVRVKLPPPEILAFLLPQEREFFLKEGGSLGVVAAGPLPNYVNTCYEVILLISGKTALVQERWLEAVEAKDFTLGGRPVEMAALPALEEASKDDLWFQNLPWTAEDTKFMQRAAAENEFKQMWRPRKGERVH